MISNVLSNVVTSGHGEWCGGRDGRDGGRDGRSSVLVYWRAPAQWARLIEEWAELTAAKGRVLTVWELINGDETSDQGVRRITLLL